GLLCRIERLRNALEEGWQKRMKRTLALELLLIVLLVLSVLAAVGAGRRTPPPEPLPELRTRQHAPMHVQEAMPEEQPVPVDGSKGR
ncbi:MAG: hypothetical protein ACRDLF_15360, partial [Solirubrobacteraceae bacterium]